MTMHDDFAAAADTFDAADADAADASARAVADALTAAERAAVDANQDFGVVGGVENGKSGVMAFSLGSAEARVGPGATPESEQPYFAYEYYTETCRANIEGRLAGAGNSASVRGATSWTPFGGEVHRRHAKRRVSVHGQGVRAGGSVGRRGELMREVANSFRVPQEERR